MRVTHNMMVAVLQLGASQLSRDNEVLCSGIRSSISKKGQLPMAMQTSLAAVLLVSVCVSASLADDANVTQPLNLEMKTLAGEEVNLAEQYKDKVVLLVNVASECGLTPQYSALQGLHARYADHGLAIVGVPCNQFNGQEPGTAAEIREFCTRTYGVEFDMLAKVEVNGEGACPLYKYLTSEASNPEFAGDIRWNFEKFLFNRQGEVVARFEPRTEPDDEAVVKAIEKELAARADAPRE